MKRLIILLLLFIAGCTPSSDNNLEVLPNQVIESQPVLSNEPTLVVTRIDGFEDDSPDFFGTNFEITNSITDIDLDSYSRVIVLYDPIFLSILSPSQFGQDEVNYGDISNFINEDGIEVTILLLNNRVEYQDFFRELEDQSIVRLDQSNVYDYFELEGTSVFVESNGLNSSSFDEVLDDFVVRRELRQQQWLYTSETIILFLEEAEQELLIELGIKVPIENNTVIQYMNPRGQTFIIGRSDSPFEGEYFLDFVSLLVEEDLNGRILQALPLEGLDDVRLSNISAEVCKLEETRMWATQHTVSHEISPKRVSSVGEVNSLVVLIDFEPFSSADEWDVSIETYEEYLAIVEKDMIDTYDFYQFMSGGKLNLQFDYYPEVITVPLFLSEFNSKFDPGFMDLVNEHIDDVLRIVEEDYDLSDTDFITFFWPFNTPSYAAVYLAELRETPLNTKNGEIYNYTLQVVSPFDNTYVVQHEIGHVIGLMDLYLYDSPENRGLSPTDKYWDWDIMTLSLKPSVYEINGWHRWMLSWISDEQVECIPNTIKDEYLVFLEPLNTNDATTRLITVNLSPTEAISIELRGPGEYCGDLCTQNVLVTHIDATISHGSGPMTILKPRQSQDLLYVGDSLSYENITITHVSRNILGSMISISID